MLKFLIEETKTQITELMLAAVVCDFEKVNELASSQQCMQDNNGYTALMYICD